VLASPFYQLRFNYYTQSPFYQLRFNYYTQSPFYQLRTITTPSLPCAPAVRAGGGRPAAARG
jgi:hypothetical protein